MEKSEKICPNVEEFKRVCYLRLAKEGLNVLRPYGRLIGLRAATKLKRWEVIQEIIAVLCGEKEPRPTKRGAPRKCDYTDPKLIEDIEQYKKIYLLGETPTEKTEAVQTIKQGKRILTESLNGVKYSIDEEKLEGSYYTVIIKDTKGKTVGTFYTKLDFRMVIFAKEKEELERVYMDAENGTIKKV